MTTSKRASGAVIAVHPNAPERSSGETDHRPRGLAGGGRRAVAVLLVVGLGNAACVLTPGGGATSGGVVPAHVAPSAVAARPFEQEVPGTAYALPMVPLPLPDDAADRALWMSATEITWDIFDVYVYGLDEDGGGQAAGVDAVTRPSKPYLPPDRGYGHEGYPVISVSYRCASEFCRWLSARTGRTFRLPTEDEWERACRAGGRSWDAHDADARAPGDDAWFRDNAERSPHPVGTKSPNAWGLYDMHGNVAEWCRGLDGEPVTRGGSFRESRPDVTCSARRVQDPSWNASDPQIPKSSWWLSDAPFVGFRVVCEERRGSGESP